MTIDLINLEILRKFGLEFGDGWVMSASNNIYSVISNGNDIGGVGGHDEVKDINGYYASNERHPGTWTDPPVDMVTPDAAPAPTR